jgi:hypothetical protein
MRFWTTDLSYNDFFNRLANSRKFVYRIVHNPASIDPRSPSRRPLFTIDGGELVTRVDKYTGSWILGY